MTASSGNHLKVWNNRLSAFVDEALTDEENREVLAHLEVCEICRARVDIYLRLRGVLSAVPRRTALRVPHLTRAPHPRSVLRLTPAVWAFSGGVAVLLLLIVTRQVTWKQSAYREETFQKAVSREIEGSNVARLPVSPPESTEEAASAETPIVSGTADLEAQEQKGTTEEALTGRERILPRAEQPSPAPESPAPNAPAEISTTETEESRIWGSPQAPPLVSEVTRRRDLLRVTLIFPTMPAEQKGAKEAEAEGVAMLGAAPEARIEAPDSSEALPPSFESITFILPENEWREFEVFLKKHYAVIVEGTAPDEIQVTLEELSPPAESSQKEEEKDEKPQKRRGRKFRMP